MQKSNRNNCAVGAIENQNSALVKNKGRVGGVLGRKWCNGVRAAARKSLGPALVLGSSLQNLTVLYT